MADYTLAVVAHVDRQGQIKYLSEAVKPDLVLVDDGSMGVMANHLSALTSAYQQARHVGTPWMVVLEDDAIPVIEFHLQLSAALDAAPTPVVSLYSGSGYPANHQRKFIEAARDHDTCYILHPALRHGVGYAVHVECMGLGLLDFLASKARDRQPWPPDDSISAWCRRYKYKVSYTNPSIVDHEDGPSVIGRRFSVGGLTGPRNRPRRAHWFASRSPQAWDSSKRIDIA